VISDDGEHMCIWLAGAIKDFEDTDIIAVNNDDKMVVVRFELTP